MIKLKMSCTGGLKECLVEPKYIKMVKPINPPNQPEVNSVVKMDDHQFWRSETVEEIEEMLKAEVTK